MTDPRDYYRTRYRDSAVRDRVWADVTRFLAPCWKLPSNAKALELGCGYGAWIRSVPAAERFGLDLHPDLPSLLASRGIDDVEAVVGSCVDLSRWADGSLDLVLASNLIEHLTAEDGERCIAESFRVLGTGGVLCIVQPNFRLCPRSYFDDYTHRTIYTDVGMRDMLEAHGFEIVRVWRRFLPLTLSSRASVLHPLVPLYLRSPWKPLAAQMCLVGRRPGGSPG